MIEKKEPCPPIGSHWELIGFQGIDPRTDLNRNMKFFAIVQMLHFLECETILAKELYKASRNSGGGQGILDMSWPFMCVSIMFTKEAMQALRSGSLNRKCNNRKSVMSVVHEYHHACFGRFYCLLSTKNDHYASHLSSIKLGNESDPLGVMKKFKSMKVVTS